MPPPLSVPQYPAPWPEHPATPVQWSHHNLRPPVVHPGPARLGPALGIANGESSPAAGGVEPIFYRSVPYKGSPTKVFAWLGLPEGLQPGEQCPGMVLLHGGGGTAFDVWVSHWNALGFAAIAMDQCGDVPGHPDIGDGGAHSRQAEVDGEPEGVAGPPGWQASFDQIQEPLEHQWPYHAVAAALRAHSLLASLPAVDATRIGLTGISWGGYLTCLVSGIDHRYKLAAPVYGCGFLGDNSGWADLGPGAPRGRLGDGSADAARWLSLWDPSHYLPFARAPSLWLNGTNDGAYPLDSWAKSITVTGTATAVTSAAAGRRAPQQCLRVEMAHSHADGWAPQEIARFAQHELMAGRELPSLPTVLAEGTVETDVVEDGVRRTEVELWCEVAASELPLQRVELCYSRATGFWQDRRYNRMQLPLPDVKEGDNCSSCAPPPPSLRVSATVRFDCVAYLAVTDAAGMLCSTSVRSVTVGGGKGRGVARL